jgi:hypothetical protein
VLENYREGVFQPLWEHIRSSKFARIGSVPQSFRFVQDDYTNAPLLDRSFHVRKENGEPEGWSVYDIRDAEGDGYSLVSSLDW